MRQLPIYRATELIEEKDLGESPCTDCPSHSLWSKTWMNCTKVPIKRYQRVDAVIKHGDQVPLVVVADAPSRADNIKSEFWGDPNGKDVLDHVKSLGFDAFIVVPAVRCYPGGDIDHFVLKKKYKGPKKWNRGPSPLEIAKSSVDHCKAFVRKVLDQHDPEMILTLGPIASKAVGLGENVKRLRVTPVHPKPGLQNNASDNRGFVTTYDRFAMQFDDAAARDFARDIRKVQNLRKIGYATKRGDERTIDVHVLDTVKKVKGFVKYMLTHEFPEGEVVAFDYETDGVLLSKEHNRILNIGFTLRNAENDSYVIPYMHPETPFSQEELVEVTALLRKLFESKGAKFFAWCAHHAQFEVQMTKLFFDVWLGDAGHKPVLDTETFMYLIEEDRKQQMGGKGHYKLEVLASEVLGFTWYAKSKMKGLRDRLIKERLWRVNQYVGYDAAVTARLLNTLFEYAAKEGSLDDLLRVATKIYSEGTHYTSDLTLVGQGIRFQLLRKLRANDSRITERLRWIETTLAGLPEVKKALSVINGGGSSTSSMPAPFKSTTNKFNFDSIEHRRVLFWDVLHLAGAKDSTDKAFQKRHKDHPVIKLYAEYNGLSKLDRSYLRPIAKFLQSPSSADGRLRPSFNLITVKTGRLSAQDPNSQNMPRGDTPDKKQIKCLFEAAPGNVLIQLDFSQAEVRWLGILSKDPALIAKYVRAQEIEEALLKDPTNKELKRALKVEADMHMSTAIEMFGLDPELPFTDEKEAKLHRQRAKAICFGLIYGKTVPSLATELGLSVEETQDMVDLWFSRFPLARIWLDRQLDIVKETGFVRSPFGRWRRLPEANSTDRAVANRAGRQAQNTPIQSAASDLCIYAACMLRRALMNHPNPELRKVKLINTVHDSLIAEGPASKDVVRAYTKLAKAIFTDPNILKNDFPEIDLCVPLAVDFDIGVSWGNMTDYKFDEESLARALYDAEVMRAQPPGTLWDDLIPQAMLYDQAVLGWPIPEKK